MGPEIEGSGDAGDLESSPLSVLETGLMEMPDVMYWISSTRFDDQRGD